MKLKDGNNLYPISTTGLVHYVGNMSQGCVGFDEIVTVREFREYRAKLAEGVVMMRHVEMPLRSRLYRCRSDLEKVHAPSINMFKVLLLI